MEGDEDWMNYDPAPKNTGTEAVGQALNTP